MRMTRFAVPIAIVGAPIVLGGMTAGLIWARDQAPPAAPPQSTATAADIAVVPESPKKLSDDLSVGGQAALQPDPAVPDPAVPTSDVDKPQDGVVGKGTGNGAIQKQAEHGRTANQGPRSALGNGLADKSSTAKADGDENQAPPIPDKGEMKYPKLGSSLNRLATRVEEGEPTAEESAGKTPMHREESVAVTIYRFGNVDDVVAFLEGNGGDPRNVGEDYIEAYVPVRLLGQLSEQPGVLRVRAIAPPEPSRGG